MATCDGIHCDTLLRDGQSHGQFERWLCQLRTRLDGYQQHVKAVHVNRQRAIPPEAEVESPL